MGKRTSPAAKIQAALLAMPETVHVELGGESRPFLLCVRGSRLAKAAGREPLRALFSLVARVATVAGAGGAIGDDTDIRDLLSADVVQSLVAGSSGVDDALVELAECVWWGLLPFDEGLDPDLVEVWLTPRGVASVARTVVPALFAFAGDMADEGLAAPGEPAGGEPAPGEPAGEDTGPKAEPATGGSA